MRHGSRTRSVAWPWLLLLTLAGCTTFEPLAARGQHVRVVIRDVAIVDVVAGSLQPHSTVIVVDGRITAVGASARVARPGFSLHDEPGLLVKSGDLDALLAAVAGAVD